MQHEHIKCQEEVKGIGERIIQEEDIKGIWYGFLRRIIWNIILRIVQEEEAG